MGDWFSRVRVENLEPLAHAILGDTDFRELRSGVKNPESLAHAILQDTNFGYGISQDTKFRGYGSGLNRLMFPLNVFFSYN